MSINPYSGLTNEALRTYIRNNMKEINRRADLLRADEEMSGIKSDFLDTQNELFKAITKTKNVKKIATGNLSKFNKARLMKLLKKQDTFLNSKWSTIEGRNEIFEKQYNTLKERYPQLTKGQYENIQRFFQSNDKLFNQLKEQAYLASDNIVELISEEYSVEDLLNQFEKLGRLSSEQLNNIKQGHFRVMIKDMIDNGLSEDEAYEKYKRV